jgi:hypothetical protein
MLDTPLGAFLCPHAMAVILFPLSMPKVTICHLPRTDERIVTI